MKKKKSDVRVRRTRHPITRRRAIGTLAAGAGALLVASTARGELLIAEEDDLDPGQWVSWDDGWAYPITGVTVENWWIVEFDDGPFGIDPAGYVFDLGVWYPVVETDAEGVWYSGDDGYDYLLEHGLEFVAAVWETA